MAVLSALAALAAVAEPATQPVPGEACWIVKSPATICAVVMVIPAGKVKVTVLPAVITVAGVKTATVALAAIDV